MPYVVQFLLLCSSEVMEITIRMNAAKIFFLNFKLNRGGLETHWRMNLFVNDFDIPNEN